MAHSGAYRRELKQAFRAELQRHGLVDAVYPADCMPKLWRTMATRPVSADVVASLIVERIREVLRADPVCDLNRWIERFVEVFVPATDVREAVQRADSASRALVVNEVTTLRAIRRVYRSRSESGLTEAFETSRIVRLSHSEMQGRLYATQDFFDDTKAARAQDSRDDPGQAVVRVRASDGFIHFLLTDGHHRALVAWSDRASFSMQTTVGNAVGPSRSFRRYAAAHWCALARAPHVRVDSATPRSSTPPGERLRSPRRRWVAAR